jgi:hypothetical protein
MKKERSIDRNRDKNGEERKIEAYTIKLFVLLMNLPS